MPRFTLNAAIVLLTALSALHVRAAATALPPDAVASDTVAVIHMDSTHFNPDLLQSAATAVLGPDDHDLDEPLQKFKEVFTKATDAGADAITMVFGAAKKKEHAEDPNQKYDNGIIYITLKPDADVKTIKKMITDKMDRGDEGTIVFEQAGDWLALHEKTQAFPVKPDAARESLFADALRSINHASIQIAFIPDDATKDKMRKSAGEATKGPKEIAPLLADSKWMALAINLGDAPGITASANVANETDAKALADDIDAEFADIKAEANKPGPMALAAPVIDHVIDGLKLTQAGTHVSIGIETESLKLIADFIATMRRFGVGR